MPSTPAADAKPSLSPHRYPVVFQSLGVHTPTSDHSHPHVDDQGEPVELSAQLEVQHGQVYLHLTCRTCKATGTKHPASTPSAQSGSASTKERHPASSRPSSKGRRFSVPLSKRSPSAKLCRERSSEKRHKHAGAASTSSVSAPPHHPKQHYTIALAEISPMAAQLPLSEELRSRLHLDLHDRDAVTYSSHSTPRAAFASRLPSCEMPRSPSALSSSACPLPSRSPLVMSSRTRDNSLSARPSSSRHAASNAATYGQYLDVAEPFRSNVRSPPSPLLISSSKGMDCGQSRSCSVEDVATKARRSPLEPTSHMPRETGTRLLTPHIEKTCASQTLRSTQLSGLSLDASTPLQPQAMDGSLDTAIGLVEYEELLTLTFLGSTETTHHCSISDEERHVRRDESNESLHHRKMPWSLLRLLWPEKKDAQQSKSASAVSTGSDVCSSARQSSATPLHPPQGEKSPPRRSRLAASSPVLAFTASMSPRNAGDVPFALNQAQKFRLRFLNEDDLREFLSGYVAMRKWVKEMRKKNIAFKRRAEAVRRNDGAGKSGSPRLDVNDTGNADSSEYEVDLRESATNSPDSPSTAAYNEYPRNAGSLSPRVGPLFAENSDDVLGNSPLAASEGSDAEHHVDELAAAGSTLSSKVKAAFGCRGWQDYVRHAVDPRYGVAYATVPLFLWHTFLPLASSVLYTCQRGFLIVECLPPACSPIYSENCSLNACGAECNTAAEASLQHWNQVVCRLLAPIRTLLEVAPAATQPDAVPKCKGVANLSPTSKGPAAAQELSVSAFTTDAGFDGVPLVLPSGSGDAFQPKDDYATTFKDVFLCLSESHLLFMNSFGHVRFHFSFDEVALITHSAATDSFPAHPFVRFRLKSSEYFGTPTFVLTFVLIPDVPHRVRVPHAAASPHPPETEPKTQSRAARPTSSPSATAHDTASVISHSAPGTSFAAANSCVGFMEDEEKQRLLGRHEALLDTFEAVCPRPLEQCTLSELMSSGSGKSHSAHIRQLVSCASTGAAGSPLVSTFSNAHAGASPWMARRYGTNPILCVRVNAGDISIADPKTSPTEGVSVAATALPLALRRCFGAWQRRALRQRQTSRECSPLAQVVPSGSPTSAFSDVILRWGRDDPGLVLRDAGHDMDLSLERATRAMPLLASKEEVFQHYAASLRDSLPRSLSPSSSSPDSREAHERRKRGGAKGCGSSSAGDTYVPMAPTKRCSSIVRRKAMKGR
ncbi:hypothetical protein LSCM4_03352 [Leishmania orientalis]|uniref:Uncharacterized protein n=1 Tax=Leishmania orientalis TaxID=2249476 RepID=A0A836GXZ2_9TRYP|nr:hypothetical protein LSCM4_03352 [Leishmania orientalis]